MDYSVGIVKVRCKARAGVGGRVARAKVDR